MAGRKTSRWIAPILCALLAGTPLLGGCGGRPDGPAKPSGQDQASTPEGLRVAATRTMPDGVTAVIYHGTGSIDDGLDRFVWAAEDADWRYLDMKRMARGNLDFAPEVFAGADPNAPMSLGVLTRQDQFQLLAATSGPGKVIVVAFTGSQRNVGWSKYFEGLQPVATAQPGDVIPQRWTQFDHPLDLINTFSLLEYKVAGNRFSYHLLGTEELKGERVYRIMVRLMGMEYDSWVDMKGKTVQMRIGGQEVGPELGDTNLDTFLTALRSGVNDVRKLSVREDWIQKDETEWQDFGPTRAEVRRLVLSNPRLPVAITIILDYVELGDICILTRYGTMGMVTLEVSEFKLR